MELVLGIASLALLAFVSVALDLAAFTGGGQPETMSTSGTTSFQSARGPQKEDS